MQTGNPNKRRKFPAILIGLSANFRESCAVQRLGKNNGGYFGETIDIRAVLGEMETAAQSHGWTSEIFHQTADFKWLAWHRPPALPLAPHSALRIYLSTGIHGDEPAGPLAALSLLRENQWPQEAEIFLLPCLNPAGFTLNHRENAQGVDLNRDYLEPKTKETRAHIAWLEKQPAFDISLCLHEDWESAGFYVYELNPDGRPSFTKTIVNRVSEVCPIDMSLEIEGRPASGGIINPPIDPRTRPLWPEAFYLIMHKTRLSYTLEAPSDFSLQTRVNALVVGVKAVLAGEKDGAAR
jgi:protein MpaA